MRREVISVWRSVSSEALERSEACRRLGGLLVSGMRHLLDDRTVSRRCTVERATILINKHMRLVRCGRPMVPKRLFGKKIVVLWARLPQIFCRPKCTRLELDLRHRNRLFFIRKQFIMADELLQQAQELFEGQIVSRYRFNDLT